MSGHHILTLLALRPKYTGVLAHCIAWSSVAMLYDVGPCLPQGRGSIPYAILMLINYRKGTYIRVWFPT